MNKIKTILITIAATSLSFGKINAADDIDAILNQIRGESSSGKNTSASNTPGSTTVTVPPKKTKTTAKKKSADAPQQIQPATPAIPIWSPTDKLPKDFRGQGVAGTFALRGTNYEGCPILVAAEEFNKPTARVFMIVNGDVGLGPNRSFVGQPMHTVEVSHNKPLIFVGRGVLPGVYNVKLQ